MRQKSCDRGRVLAVFGHKFQQRGADHLSELIARILSPCGTDDAAVGIHLPRQIAAIQARKYLTAGQIARAAKDHQIECIHRDDTGNHAKTSFAAAHR